MSEVDRSVDPRPADEKYISQHPKPTPYESEILDCVVEECSEIIQAITKGRRFGMDDGYPGSGRTNRQDFSKEWGQLMLVIELAQGAGLMDNDAIHKGFDEKEAKLAKYFQTTPP